MPSRQIGTVSLLAQSNFGTRTVHRQTVHRWNVPNCPFQFPRIEEAIKFGEKQLFPLTFPCVVRRQRIELWTLAL